MYESLQRGFCPQRERAVCSTGTWESGPPSGFFNVYFSKISSYGYVLGQLLELDLVKQVLAQIVPLYQADLSAESSQNIIQVRLKQVQVDPLVLG